MPVDKDVAAMRFYTDERFVEPKPVGNDLEWWLEWR